MTLAAILSLPGERFRLVVAEGEILDTDELPALEMPYGFFRPVGGLRACANAWLRLGGPHHQVLTDGHTAEEWRLFCDAAGIELTLACYELVRPRCRRPARVREWRRSRRHRGQRLVRPSRRRGRGSERVEVGDAAIGVV